MMWEYKTLDQLGTVSRGKSKHNIGREMILNFLGENIRLFKPLM